MVGGETVVGDDLNLVSCPFKNEDGHLIEFSVILVLISCIKQVF